MGRVFPVTPATSWTEKSGTAPTYLELVPTSAQIEGFALFGMPIPLFNGVAYSSGDASWAENSVSAASYTEKSQSAPSWTEGQL